MTSPEYRKSTPAFTEISISEIDLSLLSKLEAANYLQNVAAELNYDPANVLYCGVEGGPVRDAGSFGERTKTWACTQEEVITSSESAERIGDWGIASPFYYALNTANENPAIVLFDKSKLDPLDTFIVGHVEGQPIRCHQEYQVKDGLTMDEAVVATVYITH